MLVNFWILSNFHSDQEKQIAEKSLHNKTKFHEYL